MASLDVDRELLRVVVVGRRHEIRCAAVEEAVG